ncbi:TPA: HEPN domain-containing protein [Klebsiella pneumoniae]|nr:HEPN domain-containing protein [Klebsiella pneumoniae]HBY5615704.1 HEPN domain-containing protein [Klebsiella pneumoniae]
MVNQNDLNYIARTAFRDIADQDYITARWCYKSRLSIQFCWMAQQCIEKYLKATLLFNKQSTTGLNHNIIKAFHRLKENPNFKFELTKETNDFLAYINEYGPARYLEWPTLVFDRELEKLDKTVWELRLYCRPITDFKCRGKVISTIGDEENDIEKWLSSKTPFKFRITNGYLEKVLSNKKSPHREPLIWANKFFGNRKNNTKINKYVHMRTPVHEFSMEKAIELKDYITIPKFIIDKIKP